MVGHTGTEISPSAVVRTLRGRSGADPPQKLKNKDANRETYYIDKDLHNRLKILAIQRGGSPSDLVQEAVQGLLKKYKG
jgi:hypothetical protein